MFVYNFELYFGELFFSHSVYPREQFGTKEKLSCWGAGYVKLDPGVLARQNLSGKMLGVTKRVRFFLLSTYDSRHL